MVAILKIIKRTDIPCDICGCGEDEDFYKLSLVELSNGDKILKCFCCNEEVWTVDYNIHGYFATVKPLEKIHFKSQEEAFNKCVKVISELT